MTGEQLKMEILKRGHTLKDIADFVGQSPSNFGNKLGRDIVSTTLMEEVAAALGVSPADFYQPAQEAGEQTGIAEARQREKELLRSLSMAAMQAHIASGKSYAQELSDGQTEERFIANRSMKFARAMLDEFRKRGIDK